MREFKFRAWDASTKTMTIARDLIEWMDALAEAEWKARRVMTHVFKDWVFQQYTGRKDKNDKEIYEGDYIILPAGQQCEVRYIDTAFICVALEPIPQGYPKQYESWGWSPYSLSRMEVMGNIYETPDLWK
jgi:hypothetical protein